MLKNLAFVVLLGTCLSIIGWIFWEQELQYTGPTPVPATYTSMPVNTDVDLSTFQLSGIDPNRPVFFHFYNYNCPCSRFNVSEFERMVTRFNNDIQFIAIIQAPDDDHGAVSRFAQKYNLGIPIIQDKEGHIAEALGVYSTPQAAIVKDNKLFYRGNYNKARFCTSRNTRFAELALKAMVEGKAPPKMSPLATVSYGCELPSNGFQETRFANFFTN